MVLIAIICLQDPALTLLHLQTNSARQRKRNGKGKAHSQKYLGLVFVGRARDKISSLIFFTAARVLCQLNKDSSRLLDMESDPSISLLILSVDKIQGVDTKLYDYDEQEFMEHRSEVQRG